MVTKAFDIPANKNTYLPIRLQTLPVYEDYLPAWVRRYIEVIKWYALQYDPIAANAFRRLLLAEKPDVVHFHNFQFLTFALLREAHTLKIPICLSIYDYWLFCPKAMLLRPDNSFCQSAHGTHCMPCLPAQFTVVQKALLSVRRSIFNRCFTKVDRFVVLSSHSERVLTGCGINPQKIAVVPLTLPLEYASHINDNALNLVDDSILFVGWLNDRKGVHIAIQAMPHILRQRPTAILYVIGSSVKFGDEYEARFKQFIQINALEKRIVFLGHKSPETVQNYLQHSKVLVLPEQYENMSPLVMIEAMMMGTPVVASNLGGIPEYIEDGKTGFLASPYEPRDFARKIVLLLADKTVRSTIASTGRREITERNDNPKIWELTLQVYVGLVARREPN